jgi:hypothetical protein
VTVGVVHAHREFCCHGRGPTERFVESPLFAERLLIGIPVLVETNLCLDMAQAHQGGEREVKDHLFTFCSLPWTWPWFRSCGRS